MPMRIPIGLGLPCRGTSVIVEVPRVSTPVPPVSRARPVGGARVAQVVDMAEHADRVRRKCTHRTRLDG
jgi:hypothetical protein